MGERDDVPEMAGSSRTVDHGRNGNGGGLCLRPYAIAPTHVAKRKAGRRDVRPFFDLTATQRIARSAA